MRIRTHRIRNDEEKDFPKYKYKKKHKTALRLLGKCVGIS